MYSTSEVAQRLNVTSNQLLRLIKQLPQPLPKNEMGHYLISAAALDELTALVNDREKISFTRREWHEWLQDLHRRIDQKADDIVVVQVLNHRQEIEKLTKQLNTLRNDLFEWQAAVAETAEKVAAVTQPVEKKRWWPWLS